MSDFFTDVFNALSGDEFEEVPVSIEEFVEDYLHHPPLSENQYQIIKASTQIYTRKTLVNLYGEEEGEERYKETFNEVIARLGKGCSAPYTPTYDASDGRWKRLDSFKDSFNGEVAGYDGKVHYRTESFPVGFGPMVRVTTQLGFVEDVFVNHKYWAYKKNHFYKRFERDYKPKDIEVNSLEKGDRIAIGINLPVTNEVSIGKDVAFVLGLWLGDGCMPYQEYTKATSKILSIDFGSAETESLDRYLKIVRSWGDDPRVVYHDKKKMVTVKHGITNSPRCFQLVDDFGLRGKNRFTKDIPDQVWSAPVEEVKEFVSGMFSSDGSVYFKRNDSNGLWLAEWCSVSEDMAYNFQKLLLRIGVVASIRSKTPKYTYKGVKKEGSPAYILTVGGADKMGAFQKSVRLYDHKQANLQQSMEALNKPDARNYKRIEDNIYWDQIKSIEAIEPDEYWTLSVPEHEHYVQNGAIAANSGKDMTARISCAYVVYLLLCLNDPQKYFGKPANDAIDVMNIAVNAEQANRVFFRQFVQLIKGCEWFDGKYDAKRNEVNFIKNINLISGHSESESLEGFNVIFVVLDEISGFAEENNTGNKKAKTADAIYNMHRASVDSRFPKEGKVILLSFPRHQEDFISKRYNEVVAEKTVVEKSHTFKRDPDLPDGYEGNEFTIEWEEDHITRYRYPKIYALSRPTWEVNPTKKIDDFTRAFDANPADALARFAAMPTAGGDDAVFKNHAAIDETFIGTNGVDTDGIFWNGMKPDPTKEYYIHVDLAQKHDRCAVAMAHVEKFVTVQMGGTQVKETHPTVKVDLIRWWQPSIEQSVDFKWVTDFIIQLSGMGFNIKLVTFDRWQSHDIRNFLEARGMKTASLSVGNDHYLDFMSIMYDQRLIGPDVPELKDELKKLRWIRGKIDHPRSGYKDLSDATAGAVYNAVTNTARPRNNVVEVHTLRDLYKQEREQKWEEGRNVIEPPRADPKTMPSSLKEFMGRIL